MRSAIQLRMMIWIAVIFVCLLDFEAAPALANGCSGAQTTPAPTIPERVAESSIVLDGTVEALEHDEQGQLEATATIRVHQYLKGQGPEIVQIGGFHEYWDTVSCENWVYVGQRYIFFVSEVIFNETPIWSSVQTHRREGTIQPLEENVMAVLEASGQAGPITPVPNTPASSARLVWIGVVVIAALVIGLVVGWSLRAAARR